MKTWQIISKAGFTLDFIKSVTPIEALNKFARKNGFETWEEYNVKYLGLSQTWRSFDNKILVD